MNESKLLEEQKRVNEIKANITQVSYEACFNLGDYSNEKIGLIAELIDDESADEVIDQLRQKCIDNAQPNASKAWNERMKLVRATNILHDHIVKMKAAWEKSAEFLVAQGLKASVPAFPEEIMELINSFKKNANEPVEELRKLIEPEIVIENANYNDIPF